MPKPIKRHPALQPTSREHHQGLLLCFKIREGLKRQVDPSRIKQYVDWFWVHHLKPHFEFEEKYIFKILPKDNTLIEQALEEHKLLNLLFHQEVDLVETLKAIEVALYDHIRFEERILFNEIQQIANDKELSFIEEHQHEEVPCPLWQDEFWK